MRAGFGSDKKILVEGGNAWIYHHKGRGRMSAAASLGMLLLWDVDGGLTQIDAYMMSDKDEVKAGALLAIGIVNSTVRNEHEPALALLSGQQAWPAPCMCGVRAKRGRREGKDDVTQPTMHACTHTHTRTHTLSLSHPSSLLPPSLLPPLPF